MIFQEYVESDEYKKIKEFLEYLNFKSISSKDSPNQIFKKNNISILITVR